MSKSSTEERIICESEEPAEVEEEAREWPCAACGCMLGVLHLSFGMALLLFDILTNTISHTAFAVSASLSYIICALLCFIAVRRLDRCAQLLLMCFAGFALLASLAIFLESSVDLNAHVENETELDGGVEVEAVLISLVCISLTEFVLSLITMIVCFRSLRNAYGIPSASSPYATLVVGDYRNLERQPRLLRARTPLDARNSRSASTTSSRVRACSEIRSNDANGHPQLTQSFPQQAFSRFP